QRLTGAPPKPAASRRSARESTAIDNLSISAQLAGRRARRSPGSRGFRRDRNLPCCRAVRTTAEDHRLAETAAGAADWRRCGTYGSDRAWGTVREDYSADGRAWDYFPHAHARSRAYRWNEDALAGFCDRDQYLCLGVALWNERDPILKERLFGLSNAEGNHGED